MLLSIPGVAAAPILHAVVADLPGTAPGDEAFAIATDTRWDLGGVSVTDGEGIWVVPPGTILDAGELAWVTGNLHAWQAHGGGPAWEWDDPDLRLGNHGDTLELRKGSTVLDAVGWGDQGPLPAASPGGMWRQVNGDWVTPRLHRVGESNLAAPAFPVDAVTAYAAPDSSHQILLQLVEKAKHRIALHVYAFNHLQLAEALADAAARGVAVDILLDGNVVGASQRDRLATAYQAGLIQANGGTVLAAQGGRYSHHHLKVLVADDHVAVQSENWVETGAPASATAGNRGWGIVVHDAPMADWFTGWLAADRQAWDAMPAPTSDQRPITMAGLEGRHRGVASAQLQGPFVVRPLIAPDHTAYDGLIPALLRQAEDRVWTQQLRMQIRESNHLGWDAPDRYVDALTTAAQRGVDVRVQLAAPFSSDDRDNLDVAATLREAGAEATLWDHPRLGTLHNKGWIIDDHVVIGSMNGNHHSRSANREVTLVVEGADVANYYAALFERDASAHDRRLPPASVPTLLVSVGLLASFARSCCRPSPSLQ